MPNIRPWLLWLVLFYGVWLAVVVLGDHWGDVTGHWPMALSMAAGSYVAGSTPMGGGTVGFPILVLLFHEPAAMGRDFSFAVQSIGMTSASILILSRRQPVAWSMLRPALLGSAIGTPLGLFVVAPYLPALLVKVLFAVVWASFGVLHLLRMRDVVRHEGPSPVAPTLDRNVGLAVGFFGGLFVASVTGVGIDMLIYCALVLLAQADLKVAIPTSVILMSFTSLIGVATQTLRGGMAPGAFENWLAAAPVVALGAPLGAVVVDKIGRTPTLYFVSVLCILQFVWTMLDGFEELQWLGVVLALVGVLVTNLGFEGLFRLGERMNRRAVAR
jgi:uncharacterized membrane protein YfcA